MTTHNSKFKGKAKPRWLSEEVEGSKTEGIFKSHGHYGFIEGTDLFVRGENINTALNKDKVEYVVIKNTGFVEEGKSRFEAKILSVLERYKTSYVGEVIYCGKDQSFILLDSERLKRVASFTPETDDYKIGEKVIIQLTSFDLENLQGKVIKRIGHKSDPNMEILSILEDYGVKTSFPEEVIEEVQNVNLDIEKHESHPARKDFRDIRLVTIDPSDSKDFDDAIAVYKKGDNYLLYVAISDVWSYLKDARNTDVEARRRGTSIYFLDSVIPMLPEKLSNNYCSLMPHQDRCAIVFSIEIDGKGKVLWDTMDVNPGIIHSKRRFTYGEVNEFFDGENQLEREDPEVRESLTLGLELYKMLENNRINRGYIAMEFPELKMKMSPSGEITEIYPYIRKHAQIMIENFMILANEGIARLLSEKNIPGIYRVHENPDVTKILFFVEEARKLSFEIEDTNFEKITQKTISSWFRNTSSHENMDLIYLLLLRSLQKAKYSINNAGHFGLNLKHYLHFTSPIRRYPDTMVHKMLWNYLFEKNEIPKNGGDPIYCDLHDIAKDSSHAEVQSNEISKEIKNCKIIQFMNKKVDSTFKAKVVFPAKSGAYVQLEDYYVEGFVKSRVPLILGSNVLVKPIHNSKEFKLLKVL
ncbi:ribonuclease R [Mycoplasma haemofelis Ohio2]|uniref:exoribonuclease II n=1 Tax=Mycoplasma haemofelis (strain Ohio2) TaxID=859194 RepID=F6FHF7_MYCHI|nr:ribonuclease R [Mycoplasma haemofelis Ohio2]